MNVLSGNPLYPWKCRPSWWGKLCPVAFQEAPQYIYHYLYLVLDEAVDYWVRPSWSKTWRIHVFTCHLPSPDDTVVPRVSKWQGFCWHGLSTSVVFSTLSTLGFSLVWTPKPTLAAFLILSSAVVFLQTLKGLFFCFIFLFQVWSSCKERVRNISLMWY